MVDKRKLPAQLRSVELADDLEIEDDDFLDHPDEIREEDAIDLETELWLPLFPDGSDAEEGEWRSLFGGDASLRGLAPLTATAYTVGEEVRRGSAGGYSGRGRDTGIADRLRAYGLKVVEVSGWRTRGSATFHPRGSVDHHTAGPLRGNAPSLGICINGRAGLPGPLCQVFIARDNTCYVVAAGRANHAGAGSYAGVTGNSNVYGIEHENTGIGNEPWREDQRDTAGRAHAALLDWRRNGFVCQHKEWTTRKIDKWDQSGPDMRSRTSRAWGAYDKKEIKDVAIFKSHEGRVAFVRNAYENIAGRKVENQKALDTWVWNIAIDEAAAFNLLMALHNENRLSQDGRIKTARDAADSAQKRIKSAEAAISGISESLASGGTGGSGTGVTVEQVLNEISVRLAPRGK